MDELDLTQAQLADITIRRHECTLIGKTYVDKDFRFIEPNKQLCEYLGVSESELIGKKFTDITPEPLRTIDAENARLMIEGKLKWYRLPKIYELPPNASRTYAIIDVLPILNQDREFHCFHVEIAEITREEFRKRVKETMKNHRDLWYAKTYSPAVILSSLRTCSVKDLSGLIVKIVVAAVAAILSVRELKGEVGDFVRQLWP